MLVLLRMMDLFIFEFLILVPAFPILTDLFICVLLRIIDFSTFDPATNKLATAILMRANLFISVSFKFCYIIIVIY